MQKFFIFLCLLSFNELAYAFDLSRLEWRVYPKSSLELQMLSNGLQLSCLIRKEWVWIPKRCILLALVAELENVEKDWIYIKRVNSASEIYVIDTKTHKVLAFSKVVNSEEV